MKWNKKVMIRNMNEESILNKLSELQGKLLIGQKDTRNIRYLKYTLVRMED